MATTDNRGFGNHRQNAAGCSDDRRQFDRQQGGPPEKDRGTDGGHRLGKLQGTEIPQLAVKSVTVHTPLRSCSDFAR